MPEGDVERGQGDFKC